MRVGAGRVLAPSCCRNLNAKAMKMKRHKVQDSKLKAMLGWEGLEGGYAFRGWSLSVFNCKLRFEKLRGKGSQRLAWQRQQQ